MLYTSSYTLSKLYAEVDSSNGSHLSFPRGSVIHVKQLSTYSVRRHTP